MRNVLFVLLLAILTSTVFSQQDANIKIANGNIHYRVFGKGNPILIINGGPGMNCEGFASLAALLADSNMVIIYDQRGTGESKLIRVDSTTVTMDLMVGDIETIRTKLNIKEWTVLGHSFGGILAQYYTSKCNDNVKGLILSSSGGINLKPFGYIRANIYSKLSKIERDSIAIYSAIIEKGDTSFYYKYQRAKILASAYVYDKKFVPQLAKRLTQGNPIITDLVYKDLFKKNYDCTSSLKNFNKPVLIIQGRQDIVGDGTAYEEHLVLKNSKLVFINECVHYGWIEQKEKYIGEIKSFIENVNR